MGIRKKVIRLNKIPDVAKLNSGRVQIKHPLLTVDAIIFCEKDSIILIRRKNPPYEGLWALPGGFVEYGETVESAVKEK